MAFIRNVLKIVLPGLIISLLSYLITTISYDKLEPIIPYKPLMLLSLIFLFSTIYLILHHRFKKSEESPYKPNITLSRFLSLFFLSKQARQYLKKYLDANSTYQQFPVDSPSILELCSKDMLLDTPQAAYFDDNKLCSTYRINYWALKTITRFPRLLRIDPTRKK